MFPNQRNVRMEENGIEWNRVDRQSQLSPSYPKIPGWPKIHNFVDTPKCRAWRNPLALGHGTAWDHYKMENFLHPTLKYQAATKIPSSVDTTKNTQLGVFLSTSLGFWDIGQHGTTIKWKTISIPPKKIPSCPKKYLALSIQQNTQLGVFLSTGLGFWT